MALFDRRSKIGFIGAGTVGGSLAATLAGHGYPVAAVASRAFASARRMAAGLPGCTAHPEPQSVLEVCDLVFITTPDDAIQSVVVSSSWRAGQGVVHCAGSMSLGVLGSAVDQGAVPGALHPVQAFSSVGNGIESIPGATFGIEGGPEMRAYLKEMASAIGGNSVILEAQDKPLYHVTGVMMGGMLSTLAATAAQLWESFGFRRSDGIKALAPMMRQVAQNLEASGVPGGVQGPYARGDIDTVRKHLGTLQSRAPHVLPLYCEMALAGLPFALEKGTLSSETADRIRELVTSANHRGV